jgi:hypothetical protein
VLIEKYMKTKIFNNLYKKEDGMFIWNWIKYVIQFFSCNIVEKI